MKVTDLKYETNEDDVRAAAQIVWEDSERPNQKIFFETKKRFSDGLALNPHAFAVACVTPAMYFGEKRLWVEGEICPELKDGLTTIMQWMRLWWYKSDKKLVSIESKTGSWGSRRKAAERAAVFFSGGIDALATVRANRLNYPEEHPGAIKDGLLVCGLEIHEKRIFKYVMDSISQLAQGAGIELIPVFTNLRELGPENNSEFWDVFWSNEFSGAAFAAIAHALSNRLTQVTINANDDIAHLIPYGSHPLIDANFSSSDLRIRHEGITMTRLEKTKLIAEWDLALKHLRVCNKTSNYEPDMFNCGRCEKCIRTMLALLALGALEKTAAFKVHDVSEALIEKELDLKWDSYPYYPELIDPLLKIGRHDLVNALKNKFYAYFKNERKKKLRKAFIEPLAEFDKNKLYGALRRMKRLVYAKGIYDI